jgi:hypothetical protein
LIRSRATSIVRLPATTRSAFAVPSPALTNSTIYSIVKPCAIMIASVQPSRQEASVRARGGYYAQASAVLDHSFTLPQGDGDAGPTVAGGAIGGERRVLINRD